MITLLYRDKRLAITKYEPVRQNDTRTVILKILVDTMCDSTVYNPHARVNFLSPDNITGKICSVTLTKDSEYTGYLSTTLLLNKTLTQQIGELKIWLTFSAFNTELHRQYYMTTNSVSLNILPVRHICDTIPDICDTDILVELIDGEIWAMANGEPIGDPVAVTDMENDPEWEPIVDPGEGGDDIENLSKLVQKLLTEVNELRESKADDVELVGDEIWAMSNGKKIGDPIPANDIDDDDIVWESI